ncbi:MAG: type II toxin-antitoxin system VapC family toxin [Bradymonadales bacterium]|nr:type II toxin-antitoxin system VapC family toxin [Bradymonadales bacterium]
MIALDTSVLVRYLVEDDEEQTARAAALIEGTASRGEQLFVAGIVLCEVVWVLRSSYRIPRLEVVAVLKNLVRARPLRFQDKEAIHRALAAYESKRGDFADYLISEQAAAAGCEQVATFDRALLEEDGFFEP